MIVNITNIPTVGESADSIGKECLLGFLDEQGVLVTPALRERPWRLKRLEAVADLSQLCSFVVAAHTHPDGFELLPLGPEHMVQFRDELLQAPGLTPSRFGHSWVFDRCDIQFGEWHASGNYHPELTYDAKTSRWKFGHLSVDYARDAIKYKALRRARFPVMKSLHEAQAMGHHRKVVGR